MSNISDVIFFIVTGLLIEHIITNRNKQEGLESIIKTTRSTFDAIGDTVKAVSSSVGEMSENVEEKTKKLSKKSKDPMGSVIKLIKKLVKIPVKIAKIIKEVGQDPKSFPLCILPGGMILIIPYLTIELIKAFIKTKIMLIIRFFVIPGESRMKGIRKDVLIKKYEKGVSKNINKVLWYILYACVLGFYTLPLFMHYLMQLPWKFLKFFFSSRKKEEIINSRDNSPSKEFASPESKGLSRIFPILYAYIQKNLDMLQGKITGVTWYDHGNNKQATYSFLTLYLLPGIIYKFYLNRLKRNKESFIGNNKKKKKKKKKKRKQKERQKMNNKIINNKKPSNTKLLISLLTIIGLLISVPNPYANKSLLKPWYLIGNYISMISLPILIVASFFSKPVSKCFKIYDNIKGLTDIFGMFG
tara:strand:+ start:1939 stop:3180 length:1242 start_codon:yes stop_codon:yes gene_type:complete